MRNRHRRYLHRNVPGDIEIFEVCRCHRIYDLEHITHTGKQHGKVKVFIIVVLQLRY